MQNPLEQFSVHNIGYKLMLGSYDISFNNTALFMVIAVVCVFVYFSLSLKKANVVPSRMQMVTELMYDMALNTAKDNIGEKYLRFFPLIFTIFLFFLFSNLIGMIPFSFSVSSQIIITATAATIVFMVGIIYGLLKHNIKFFKLFYHAEIPLLILPLIIPSEIISFLAKTVSMAVRLFANIMAGHIMLFVFGGFVFSLGFFGILPVAFTTVLIGFEFFIAILHAYIFTILSCIFLGDIINLH